MATGAAAADELLAATLAGLPASEHGYLVAPPAAQAVAFGRLSEAMWLDGQINLQGRRWPSVDRRVRATLWWYSVSQVFLTPTLASLFVTGQALSPKPNDLMLCRFADGTVVTARSTRVLDGEPVEAAAAGLRESLEFAIPLIARAGAARVRPLWAIATDSVANRLLWLGSARGEQDRATALAARIADFVGSPLPAPRFIEVERRAPRTGRALFVRRASCCLIYFEPGVVKCASCPRLTPEERSARLRTTAEYT